MSKTSRALHAYILTVYEYALDFRDEMEAALQARSGLRPWAVPCEPPPVPKPPIRYVGKHPGFQVAERIARGLQRQWSSLLRTIFFGAGDIDRGVRGCSDRNENGVRRELIDIADLPAGLFSRLSKKDIESSLDRSRRVLSARWAERSVMPPPPDWVNNE